MLFALSVTIQVTILRPGGVILDLKMACKVHTTDLMQLAAVVLMSKPLLLVTVRAGMLRILVTLYRLNIVTEVTTKHYWSCMKYIFLTCYYLSSLCPKKI